MDSRLFARLDSKETGLIMAEESTCRSVDCCCSLPKEMLDKKVKAVGLELLRLDLRLFVVPIGVHKGSEVV